MLKCEINGTEYRLLQNFSIVEHLGNKTETNISVYVEEQAIPNATDFIRIYNTETNEDLFTGVCGTPKSPKYNNFNTVPIFNIKCRNLNTVMDYRFINYSIEDVNLTTIINDIFNDFIAIDGITMGQIGNFDDVTFDIYNVPNKRRTEVLNELAQFGNAIWNIDSRRRFNFVKKGDFTRFNREINQSFCPFEDLQIKSKDLDVRTSQTVTGGTETTTEQTQNFTYDGENNSFEVTFPIIRKPRIFINGTELSEMHIGVNGLDDDDDDIYFLFSNRSKVINYKEDSNQLEMSDQINVRYFGEFDIRVQAFDETRIRELRRKTGFSGIIENVINNNSIETRDDAERFANAVLEENSTARTELSATIRDFYLYNTGHSISDFEVGTIVNFDLANINLTGDFVITERKISTYTSDRSERNLQVQLKFKDRNFTRSYAQTLKDIDRNLNDLRVRENEIVLINNNITDEFTMSEIMNIVTNFTIYPSTTTNIVDPTWFSGDFNIYM